MIILDTNVLSEFMRPRPDERVVAWLDLQPSPSVWTTAVTVFEIEFGLQRMPESRRKKEREDLFREMIRSVLRGRILAFDTPAAVAAGALSAALQAQGRPLEIRDVQIAGIARVRGVPVATRNTKHFEHLCDVIDPWDAS
jgi:predicted nucleic acid-binding protein